MDANVSATLAMLVASLGLFGGILSGVLGIGGGIIMTPLLLYVPPACRQPALSMQVVAGLTIVQSLFAALSGTLSHHGRGTVDVRLALWLGGTMVVTTFGGAWWSGSVGSEVLLTLFAVLATVAAGLMLLPHPGGDQNPDATAPTFDRTRAGVLGIAIGFTGGMVGQSGAFMVVPAMIHVLKIPVRTAIGTTLAVVVLAALAGTAGKLAAGQVVFPLAAALALPAVVGARIGARWSHRIPADALRHILALIISVAAVRIWYDVMTQAS